MSTIIDKRNLLQEFQEAFIQRENRKSHAQQQAMDFLLTKGLPGAKSEEYKFAPVTRYLEKHIEPHVLQVTQTHEAGDFRSLISDLKSNVLAFVNGQYSEEQSVMLDEDLHIRLTTAEDAMPDNDSFDLLNRAFNENIVEVTVGSNKSISHPLAVVYYVNSAQFVFANPRWRCTIGTNSSLTLLEYIQNQESNLFFHNKQSFVEIGENASLEYIVIQNGSTKEIQVNNGIVRLASSARASCFTLTFGGKLVRNNFTLIVDGQGADAHLYGLYLLSKNTLADNHTVVDHRSPNSYSNELYKGVMDENSKGVFNGKIYVRPLAQKTNAFQSNRNILLGESATINTKPQLEIWADDVKCSHGCTTGQLDEEALFYLRSRGISKDVAKGMILYAFAMETLVPMKNELIRNFIDALISEKLHKDF